MILPCVKACDVILNNTGCGKEINQHEHAPGAQKTSVDQPLGPVPIMDGFPLVFNLKPNITASALCRQCIAHRHGAAD